MKSPKYFEDSIDIVQQLEKLVLISKQKDYGAKNILDCGELGVVVRLNDKLARLKNLYGITDGSFKQKEASNESIEDTLVDIANYATIALMCRKGIFDVPVK